MPFVIKLIAQQKELAPAAIDFFCRAAPDDASRFHNRAHNLAILSASATRHVFAIEGLWQCEHWLDKKPELERWDVKEGGAFTIDALSGASNSRPRTIVL